MTATTDTAPATDVIRAAAALSDEEIVDRLDRLFREKAAVEGSIVVLLGEVERRQTYRQDGATSSEAWTVERFGVSMPTARAYSHLAGEGVGHSSPGRRVV